MRAAKSASRFLIALLFLSAVCGLGLAADQAEGATILGQLDELERKTDELNRKFKDLNARRAQLDRDLAESMNRSHQMNAELGERRERLGRRLREAYKLSSGAAWEYLLASRDFGEYVLRRRYLARLWEKDRELVLRFQRHLADMDSATAEIEQRRKEIDALAAAMENEKKSLDTQLAKRRSFVESVRRDEKLKAQAAQEMQSAQKDLNRGIGELKGAAGSTEFALLKGKMLCPVSGAITKGYGESVEGRGQRFHGGLDIRAKDGAPISAPAAGKVVFAGRFRGFGNMVIIDHGDSFYTLYAHLKELMMPEGASVKRGQSIGHVGSTGSLEGAYLYFELRHKGKSINPDDWVRCR
jgi:septal ring factor EnvC (AmiA/AmiB activator)